jgi:poly(A) polymerase
VEDAERLWQRLRLTNAERERLVSIADRWWRVQPGRETDGRALLYRLGPERFTDRVLVAWARSDDGVAGPAWRTLAMLPQRWTAPAFPLRAVDFVQRGVEKGPALGVALRAAEEAWIAADFPEGADAIAGIVEATVRRVGGAG